MSARNVAARVATAGALAALADHLPALARAAADRRAARKSPLTRSAALAEAPWDDDTMPRGYERAFRSAYADRLLERGLALPTCEGRSGPSGPSGKARHPAVLITGVSPQQLAAWDRAAATTGVSRSEWARGALDRASSK